MDLKNCCFYSLDCGESCGLACHPINPIRRPRRPRRRLLFFSLLNVIFMAFPAWASAAIAGGASIGGTIIGASATQKANHDARNFALMAYDMEKKDAWDRFHAENEYNEMAWNKMNAYNSPMAQMERFKEAGLNPNLIYGNMSNAPAITTARAGGPDSPKWKPDVPKWDLNAGIMATINAKESAARVNNLEVQNDVLKQEAAQKAAETAGIGIRNSKTQVELDLSKALFQNSVDAANAALNKTQVETNIALQRNEREAAMNSSNIREATERIANMRGLRVNQELDAKLKTLDIELKRMGVQPGDNVFLRMLMRVINKVADGDPMQNLDDNLKRFRMDLMPK